MVHNERSAFYRERFLKLYPVRTDTTSGWQARLAGCVRWKSQTREQIQPGPALDPPLPNLAPASRPVQVSAYALSWLVAELPYVLVLVGSFINVWYWACGYSRDADRFLMYWLYLFEIVTFYTYFGQFLGTPHTAQFTTPGSPHTPVTHRLSYPPPACLSACA